MNMLILAALLVSCSIGIAGAQDADLRAGNLRPRTALMSEEVARQRLVTFGLGDIRNLRMEGSRWSASANHGGQRIDVDLDSVTGLIYERGRAEPMRVPEQPGTIVLRDHSLKMQRDEIARVPIGVEPLAPDRPTAIRPLGDRPVAERPQITPPPDQRPAKPGR